ncbi:12420_t:CDS:2, partial [Gigaspora margarita]
MDLKDLNNCTGQSVVNTVFSSIICYSLNPSKWLTWTTDNTAYMSGNQKEAVVHFSDSIFFNIKCQFVVTGYELCTAKQYLEWHKKYIEFANWFIKMLEKIVTFGGYFYKPLMQFMVKTDTIPHIQLDNYLVQLLPALESLNNEDFGKLFDNLECRINKAYEHFVKWITPWMHLPLSICRFEPTKQKIKFAEQLYNDFKVSYETFGLHEELLNNPEFKKEFYQF